MTFANLSIKFPSGVGQEDFARSAQTFHSYLLDRAHDAGLEVPIVVKTEENEGHVFISAGDHASTFLKWTREWRLRNPSIVSQGQAREGLPDDDFEDQLVDNKSTEEIYCTTINSRSR